MSNGSDESGHPGEHSDRQVDLREFLEGFLAESDDHLRACRAVLVTLDEAARAGRAAPAAVRQIYRGLHTIKGLAAMVGVDPVVELSHHMETVVRIADREGGHLPASALDPLVRGLDIIEQMTRALSRGEAVPSPPTRLLAELGAVEPAAPEASEATHTAPPRLLLEPALADKLTAAEHNQLLEGLRQGRRALRIDFTPATRRAEAGVSITSVREVLARHGELVRVLPVSRPRSEVSPGSLAFTLLLVTAADDATLCQAAGLEPELDHVSPLFGLSTPGAAAAPPDASDDGSDDDASAPLHLGERFEPVGSTAAGLVRVSVGRLDAVMQSLSALVVTRHRLGRVVSALSAHGVEVHELRAVFDEQARQLRDLREAVLQLRMIPVAELLERIPLIVRGLRLTTGKAVRAELAGGVGAELDKSVAERVFPALVHLVRNAVDHGIESPAERRAAGKAEEGVVRIEVGEPSGNRLELWVEDDGRGIDPQAVARRAARPVPGNDRELLELMVLPGLSTRDEVTTTSGRGMGMDIVQRIVMRELGGELELENRREAGAGARFTLRIPMTVSIIDSLAFECGGQAYVAPLGSVEEIVDLADLRRVAAPDPGRRRRQVELLPWRGELVAHVPLAYLLAHGRDHDQGEQVGCATSVRKAMVVRSGGALFSFGVDRMLGQQEVVVRPLEDPLVRVDGVTGTTDLGDGRPTLVLDLVALGRRLSGSGASGAALRRHAR